MVVKNNKSIGTTQTKAAELKVGELVKDFLKELQSDPPSS